MVMTDVPTTTPETAEYGVWAVWDYNDAGPEAETVHKDLRAAVEALDSSSQICFWRYGEKLKAAIERWNETGSKEPGPGINAEFITLGRRVVFTEGTLNSLPGIHARHGSLTPSGHYIPVRMTVGQEELEIGMGWDFMRRPNGDLSFEIGIYKELSPRVGAGRKESIFIDEVEQKPSADVEERTIITKGIIKEIWYN